MSGRLLISPSWRFTASGRLSFRRFSSVIFVSAALEQEKTPVFSFHAYCERGVIDQKTRLLSGRSAQGILLRGHPHGRGKSRSRGSGRGSGRWERQWRVQRGDRRENKQSLRRLTHGWDDAHHHLSQRGVTHHYKCAQTREKGDVWGVLFILSVGCSRLPSAVNEPTTTNLKKNSHELHQLLSQFHHEELEEEGCHLRYCWKGIGSARSLLILGGDGSLMWLRLGSLIEVSSVRFCQICSVWDTNVFDI